MDSKILAIIVVISMLAVGAAVYAVQMRDSGFDMMGGFNTRNPADVDKFFDKMQEEHNEMMDLHKKLTKGEITQEKFNKEMLEHMNEMRALHEETGMGCPMMTSSMKDMHKNGMMNRNNTRGMMG